jgi:hypothetical protein
MKELPICRTLRDPERFPGEHALLKRLADSAAEELIAFCIQERWTPRLDKKYERFIQEDERQRLVREVVVGRKWKRPIIVALPLLFEHLHTLTVIGYFEEHRKNYHFKTGFPQNMFSERESLYCNTGVNIPLNLYRLTADALLSKLCEALGDRPGQYKDDLCFYYRHWKQGALLNVCDPWDRLQGDPRDFKGVYETRYYSEEALKAFKQESKEGWL